MAAAMARGQGALVHLRLHLRISKEELRDCCGRSHTEQTDTSAREGFRDLFYKKHSWSGTIEAISRCVAAYHNAADELDAAGLENIMNKVKRHTQALHEKCVPNPYLQEDIVDPIADYIYGIAPATWRCTC